MSNAKSYHDWDTENEMSKSKAGLDSLAESYYFSGVVNERIQIIEMLTNSMSNGTSRGMRRAIKLIEGLDE